MDLFLSSSKAVFTLFVILLMGIIAKKLSIIKDGEQKGINRLFSKVVMPCFIFTKVYSGDLKNGFRLDVTIYILSVAIIIFTVLLAIISKLVKDKKRQTAILLCTCRANTAIYGFPLAAALVGEVLAYDVIIMLSPFVLLQNAFASMVLERQAGQENVNSLKIIGKAFKNPLIIATLFGLAFQLLSIKIPDIVFSPLESVGSIAMPLSFLLLGTTFEVAKSYINRKAIILSVLTKLIIIPIIGVGIGLFLFDFKGIVLVTLLCCFATPSSVSSYPLTAAYGGDGVLAGEIITYTTVISLITVLLMVFTLNMMNVL